jgi:uncharacterized coiled-coil protein SlyX
MKIKILATMFFGLLCIAPATIYAQNPTEEACVVAPVPAYIDHPSCVYPYLGPKGPSSCYLQHLEIKQRWEANCRFYFNERKKEEMEKQNAEQQKKIEEETRKHQEEQHTKIEELQQQVDQLTQKAKNMQKRASSAPKETDFEKNIFRTMQFVTIPPTPTMPPTPTASPIPTPDVLSSQSTRTFNLFERFIQAIKIFFGQG